MSASKQQDMPQQHPEPLSEFTFPITFRPRLGRLVPAVLAPCVALMMIGLGLVVPSTSAENVAWFAATGVVIAIGLARFATVHAKATDDYLVVRNIGASQRIPWASIVNVTFSDAQPFVRLDLDNGLTETVMAIQSSDGSHSVRQAQHLANLVAVKQLPAPR